MSAAADDPGNSGSDAGNLRLGATGARRREVHDQIDALLEESVKVVSFTFGIPDARVLSKLKERGVAVIGSMALIPQMVDTVKTPVIAAGGIMNGRGVVGSLALGAEGVQMGSAFLPCVESGAHGKYKEAVVSSTDESTVITRAFSGKPARGIRNPFITDMERYAEPIPPYPVQNALTRDIRVNAAKQGRMDLMSMWAGQAAGLSTAVTAADVVWNINQQVVQILGNLLSRA